MALEPPPVSTVAEPAQAPLPSQSAAPSGALATHSAAGTEPQVLDVTVIDQLRREIKQRLSYFQACADGARRRNGVEVRRLQATWSVTADGLVKELKVEGVSDLPLVACIVHVGSRPLTTKPGQDLVIPTPIVFVR
jgi:hypothetical protein